MPDRARSDHPGVQAQLDRLWRLSPGADALGLGRIRQLLDRLGNPQAALPPAFHVAGTNGKGSTCAFLRAALEAAGKRVHVYTSPHLVRFNERIRLAGRLIEDEALEALLAAVLDAGGDIGASFFEVTTAAAFKAFAEKPADACVIEVGLGGRLDATNVLPHPAATGIAQLGLDHQQFLGDTVEAIAAEKAGIVRAGVPLVVMAYPPAVAATVAAAAGAAGARLIAEGAAWRVDPGPPLTYSDRAGSIETAPPRLAGRHQARNLGLALAMLRHQDAVPLPLAALRAAADWAEWPARMQRLAEGPLTRILPPGSALWLDGGHNPAAAEAVRDVIATHAGDRAVHLILGMLANKDARGLLRPLAPLVTALQAIPIAGHEHHPPPALAAIATDLGIAASSSDDVASALSAIARRADPERPPLVLVLGSLYLAGDVLARNGQTPG